MIRKLALLALSSLFVVSAINPASAEDPFVITFEDSDTSFVKVDFGGNVSTVQAGGIDSNTSKVLKIVRGNVSWSGTTVFNSASKALIKSDSLLATAKIYSPTAGVKLMLKVEDRSNPTKSVEAYATANSSVGWADYTFNFAVHRAGTTAYNPAVTYNLASFFMDYTLTDGAVTTVGQSYYIDDVTFPAATGGGGGSQNVTAPVTLLTYDPGDTLGVENAALATLEHPVGIFEGATGAIHDDPPSGAFGTKALAITKTGAPWAGLNALVDTTGLVRYTNAQYPIVSFNFYTPKSSSPVAVQLFSGGSFVESQKVASQGWSTLSFDFSAVNGWSANTIYDKVVIFPDFQIPVSTPADVYYIDDVALNGGVTPTIIVTPPPPPPPADVKPSATKAASVTGKNAKVGTILTVSKGTWTGTAPISYKYSWYRCTNKASTATAAKPTTAAKCVLISGKTSSIYKLVSADKGKYIRAMITATNVAGTSYSTSKSTAVKVS